MKTEQMTIVAASLQQPLLAAMLPIMESSNAIYFEVQICEHLDISHLTEKKVKIDNNKLTAI